jgi:predicted AlkP superfamily pyrophosphatase or phosphodiesterase
MMQKLFILLLFANSLSASAQIDTTQKVISERRNSPQQQKKPYVILISVDGFRYDYAQKFKAENLLALSRQGVSAESMIPSFPSLTFPNHYTITTGLYPSHHGIVDNAFYDPEREESYKISDRKKVRDGSWYGGTPLWVLAEQQQMLTASFYWVGTEADIKGVRPTYYYNYNEEISISKRIQTVKDWLSLPEERRPHLITFYFPEVDHAGHHYGPDAPETAEAVRFIDSAVYELDKAVKSFGLPVNFIFVSDHGMTKVDTVNTLPQPAEIDTSKFIVSGGGILVQLFARDKVKADVQEQYLKLKKTEKNFKVYLKTNLPQRLHYGEKDDRFNRIGDIILIPRWPKVFNLNNRKTSPGWHGYDPYLLKDMHSVFYAWGPAFKSGLKIPSFENVNIYPLITDILHLESAEKIDGNKDLANKILK